MEEQKKKLSLIVAERIAEQIYYRVTNKIHRQLLFFDGINFKLAPEKGTRSDRYQHEMSLVALYNEPSYEMVLEDVHNELVSRNFSEKKYKQRTNWLGYKYKHRGAQNG